MKRARQRHTRKSDMIKGSAVPYETNPYYTGHNRKHILFTDLLLAFFDGGVIKINDEPTQLIADNIIKNVKDIRTNLYTTKEGGIVMAMPLKMRRQYIRHSDRMREVIDKDFGCNIKLIIFTKALMVCIGNILDELPQTDGYSFMRDRYMSIEELLLSLYSVIDKDHIKGNNDIDVESRQDAENLASKFWGIVNY